MPPAHNPITNAPLDAWGRRNPRKLADCSCNHCGKTFRPRSRTHRFCSRACQGRSVRTNDGVWAVSRRLGYVVGYVWEGGKKRQVRQHRYFVEQALGRRLWPDEDVHHINGIKTDNRLENLQVLSKSDHSRLSCTEYWTPERRLSTKTTHCKHGHPFDEANTRLKKGGGRICRECVRVTSRLFQASKRARKRGFLNAISPGVR